MSDVAARVGVTEPVIFQNFGTKAELFAAALDRVSEEAAAHLRSLVTEHQEVHEWLRHLLAAEHLDHLHTAPMFGVLFEDAHRLQFEPRSAPRCNAVRRAWPRLWPSSSGGVRPRAPSATMFATQPGMAGGFADSGASVPAQVHTRTVDGVGRRPSRSRP